MFGKVGRKRICKFGIVLSSLASGHIAWHGFRHNRSSLLHRRSIVARTSSDRTWFVPWDPERKVSQHEQHSEAFHTASTRPRPSIRSTFSSHAQSRTQAQEAYRLSGSKVVQRIQQDLQMSGEVLLILLQDREEFLELFVVDGLHVAGRLVEIPSQAGGVVGKQGAGASNF